MFTGLVQHLGTVVAVESTDAGRRLTVDLSGWSHRPEHGESIAVNGCCLTVAGRGTGSIPAADRGTAEAGRCVFDVIAQTLSVTALGSLEVGDRINLEHSVTPTTMLGGHIMQGHVDGVGRVTSVKRSAGEHRLRIEPPKPSDMWLVVDKGSIAVQGVSLTVAVAGDRWFEVALIPTTLALTNLGALKPNDLVNLEFDYLAKVVVNWLERRRGGSETDHGLARPDLT